MSKVYERVWQGSAGVRVDIDGIRAVAGAGSAALGEAGREGGRRRGQPKPRSRNLGAAELSVGEPGRIDP